MDEKATPPTTPEVNGQAPPARWDDAFDAEPIPQVPDGDKLQLSPEGWEYLADLKWVDEEYNLGRWDTYLGNYIAVYKQQLLGFGPNPLTLRDEMARVHHAPTNRIVITYIEPSPIG